MKTNTIIEMRELARAHNGEAIKNESDGFGWKFIKHGFPDAYYVAVVDENKPLSILVHTNLYRFITR
jgi:hypothetical protein